MISNWLRVILVILLLSMCMLSLYLVSSFIKKQKNLEEQIIKERKKSFDENETYTNKDKSLTQPLTPKKRRPNIKKPKYTNHEHLFYSALLDCLKSKRQLLAHYLVDRY